MNFAYGLLPKPNVCRVLFFFLIETSDNKGSLHGVLGLVVLWGLYWALLIYSPIFHTWAGFTHHPVGKTTTYTSLHGGTHGL